jgi:hypothetical protein
MAPYCEKRFVAHSYAHHRQCRNRQRNAKSLPRVRAMAWMVRVKKDFSFPVLQELDLQNNAKKTLTNWNHN